MISLSFGKNGKNHIHTHIHTHASTRSFIAGGKQNILIILSDDVIKIKFVKLWDLSRYSERTVSKTSTCQKLAFRGKLSLRY